MEAEYKAVTAQDRRRVVGASLLQPSCCERRTSCSGFHMTPREHMAEDLLRTKQTPEACTWLVQSGTSRGALTTSSEAGLAGVLSKASCH